MKEGLTTDPMDIKRIINKYWEQLCTHKFYNLDEMDSFLQRHNITKLIQEEKDTMKRQIYKRI